MAARLAGVLADSSIFYYLDGAGSSPASAVHQIGRMMGAPVCPRRLLRQVDDSIGERLAQSDHLSGNTGTHLHYHRHHHPRRRPRHHHHHHLTGDSRQGFGLGCLRLLWTPAQRKRASMLYFANVFFIFFFMAALFSGPG